MTHPFEENGLGRAPFKLTRAEIWNEGGRCDHCGTRILYAFHIKSTDNRNFVVGSTCVEKAGDSSLTGDVLKEKSRLVEEAHNRKVDEEAVARLTEGGIATT